MAISDYITCCKCGVKLIYDGNREQRGWWEQRWNKEPEIECPDCKTEQAQPVALEAVYETIIQWDEGGGKRSRRELARRIVSLYTSPPQRKPLTRNAITDRIARQVSKTEEDQFVLFARAIEAAHGIKEKNT